MTEQPEHTADNSNRRLSFSLNLLPAVILGVTCLFGFMWYFQPARHAAISILSDQEIRFAVVALGDPNTEIAADVCHSVIEREIPFYLHEDVKNELVSRPNLALRCLLDAKTQRAAKTKNGTPSEDNPSPAATDGTPAKMTSKEVLMASQRRHLLYTLGNEWLARAQEAPGPDCSRVESAHAALQAVDKHAEYKFLRCAAQSGESTTRQCCIQALDSGGEENKLEFENPHISKLTEDLPHMARAAFPSEYNEFAEKKPKGEDADKSAPSEETVQAQALFEGKRQAEYQSWVLDVACTVHLDDPNKQVAQSALLPVLESDGCAPTSEPWLAFFEQATWSQACGQRYPELRAQGVAPPKTAFCKSLSDVSVDRAVIAASNRVSAAVSASRMNDGVDKSDSPMISGGMSDSPSGSSFGALRRLQNYSKAARTANALANTIMGY